MSLIEHEEISCQVEDLFSNGYVRESLSPCVVPALLIRTVLGVCMWIAVLSIRLVRYRFPIPRLYDLLDQIG